MIQQKDVEIAEKESIMRDAFTKWESDVREHQECLERGTRQREESLRKEVFDWQEHIRTQWELKEGEFQAEVKRLQDLVSRKDEEIASLKKKPEPKGLFRDLQYVLDDTSLPKANIFQKYHRYTRL